MSLFSVEFPYGVFGEGMLSTKWDMGMGQVSGIWAILFFSRRLDLPIYVVVGEYIPWPSYLRPE